MGCPCEIVIEAAPRALAAATAQRAQQEVDRLDRKYSHYRDDSLPGLWAAAAGSDQVFELDAETIGLLSLAAALNEQSAGAFDVTARPLTRLWDPRLGRVPDQPQIDAARRCVGWSRLVYQPPQLRLPLPGMCLDLGGIVKEYAADRAAALCRAAGVTHGLVDLGGDIAVIGAHADGSPWRAGIKNPRATADAIAEIELAAGGLATSGDYERALVVDGQRYSHIIDPRSGWPVASYASVSAVAPSCLVAGAATTLAMLLGVPAGEHYLRELGLLHLCVLASGALLRG